MARAASRCSKITLGGSVSIVCLGSPHPRFNNATAASTRSFGLERFDQRGDRCGRVSTHELLDAFGSAAWIRGVALGERASQTATKSIMGFGWPL